MRPNSLFTVLAFALACPSAFADTFTVTLRTVDADGKPVAKAEVGMFWQAKDGVMSPGEKTPVVTGADGKAELRVDDWQEVRPVLVLSADRKLGGMAGVSRADDGKTVTVTLGPTVRLKGKFSCKELGRKPGWTNAMISAEGWRAPFAQNITTAASFDFVLPAGKFKLYCYGSDVLSIDQKLTLTAKDGERDLGTLDMKASPLAKFRGKAPPDWVLSDARGVNKNVKLADYKGKWVYLEFWGFW